MMGPDVYSRRPHLGAMPVVGRRIGLSAAFRLIISPTFVLTFTWAIALIMYQIGAAIGYSQDYFSFMAEGVGLAPQSTPWAFLWLGLAYTFFLLGVIIVKLGERPIKPTPSALDGQRFIRILMLVFAITLAVAFLWIGVAIIQFGGIARIAAAAASENTLVRRAITGASFPGGRLISSGFVGIAVLCSVRLASADFKTSSTQRFSLIVMLLLALLYLGLVPILLSGRINFFVACIGSYVAASIASGRPLGVAYLVIGIGLLCVVWTAKQYFVMGHTTDDSVFSQAWQSMLFYFYNDMYNGVVTVENSNGYRTLGWNSLRFVFFLTFTNDLFYKENFEAIYYIGQWMGGGEVPLLSGPYIDFGFAGLIVLFLMGAIYQAIFHYSKRHMGWSAAYGLVFAGLLLSTHASYITSQEVVYNLLMICGVARMARRRVTSIRHRTRPSAYAH